MQCILQGSEVTSTITSPHQSSTYMSAPSIPNLNTLRRGGLRGRVRGRGGSGAGAGTTAAKGIQHDTIVQNTDHDAATSRLSAVDAGYLEDPFAHLLTPTEGVSRRLPLMNRGRNRS